MYLGGGEISADDPKVTHSSYRTLGLRCTICGEPVQYKNGYVNATHFAHFPSLDPKKREACNRRTESIGGYGSGWSKMKKGQKLVLFQKHFFTTFRASLQGLEPFGQWKNAHESEELDSTYIEALLFLRDRKKDFVRYIRTCDHHRVGLLEVNIACEAFDYLMVISSQPMALSILKYLMDIHFKNSSDTKQSLEAIGLKLSDILLRLNWPQVFTESKRLKAAKNNFKKKRKLKKPYDAVKLFHKVEGGHNLFVYLKGKSVFLGVVEEDDLRDQRYIGTLNVIGLLRHERSRQTSKRQDISDPFTVRIVQKGSKFHLSETLVENRFLPLLKEAIQSSTSRSKKSIVEIKGNGENVRLSMTTKKFLRMKSATIISKGVSIAEVIIENAMEEENASSLFRKFFTYSKEYSKSIQDELTIHDAVTMLVRKTHRVLRKVPVIPTRCAMRASQRLGSIAVGALQELSESRRYTKQLNFPTDSLFSP